jgi:2-keto-3-deoxy-L-rhamnonate aldolase RhmA
MGALELKAKWRRGDASPGVWVHVTDPTITEIIGLQNPDWIMIDAEHAALDLQTIQTLLLALECSTTVPLVRVPSDDPVFIKRVLDMGAAGILVPQVSTAEDARRVVAACKYPPEGNRGAGPRRAGRFGTREQAYLDGANAEIIVLAMIESVTAVRDIDAILATPGLDGLVIGPLDLSASLGLLSQVRHPRVLDAIDTVATRARAAHMPFGSGRAAESAADMAEWLALGAQLIAVGSADGFVHHGTRSALETFSRVASASSPA